ncbi:hypothetical protein [Miniimonas sp. S16]|uniref:hypothetical protein n=1 Tax=Miniimonas sp. S16 TaxID=2171623 RepID=UPI001F47A333|nr:hypothetical protein [Miniimonas sp. S16]
MGTNAAGVGAAVSGRVDGDGVAPGADGADRLNLDAADAVPPVVLAPPERRTRPQIMLDTLIAATMCILRTGVLPTTGGAPTQFIVTLDGADLLAALRHQTPTPAETANARNAQGTRHAPNARDRAPSATPDTPEPDEPFDPRSRPGPTRIRSRQIRPSAECGHERARGHRRARVQ